MAIRLGFRFMPVPKRCHSFPSLFEFLLNLFNRLANDLEQVPVVSQNAELLTQDVINQNPRLLRRHRRVKKPILNLDKAMRQFNLLVPGQSCCDSP